MCTAITYRTRDHYFGRSLDLEYSYQETVTITPRNYSFSFRKLPELKNHYAIIGVAYVLEDYPLYYDATNEKGLSMAGLHFPGSAVYNPCQAGVDNVATFELIPWILGQCATVDQAQSLLERANIADLSFREDLPASTLHWFLADQTRSVTVEAVREGLKIYPNPVGVLTNEPPFPFHMAHLSHYMGLSAKQPQNRFAPQVELIPYSRGMGGIGLPGDLSSASRFVKAAFTKCNSVSGDSEEESVGQFFHILDSVEQQRGAVEVGEGKLVTTVYASCCNMDRGIYYYTTYDNRQITAVDLHKENLEGETLVSYPLIQGQQICYQN